MYTDLLILLFAAVLLVATFRRLGLPVILAYLIAGVLLGPHGLAVITGQSIMQTIAELGIVFLMFSLGLEFSLPKLLAMRRLVLGVGMLQVLLTSLLFFAIGWWWGLGLAQSLVVAGTLALSSTAVVIKQLGEQKQLHTRRAQLGVSVLLFQDLAVVPLLVMIPILAQPEVQGSALAAEIAWATLKGLFALFTLLAVGKWLLPLLFHEVARARSDELFVLSALLVALLAAYMTHSLGLSMALGAFLAGMMLGESHYRHQLEVDIKPFRDVLMGLFFITIGMAMEWELVARAWWQVLICVVLLVLCKSLLVLLAGRLMGERKRDSMAAGIMLSQVGVRLRAAGAGAPPRLAGSTTGLPADRHRHHLHRHDPLAGDSGPFAGSQPHRPGAADPLRSRPVGPEQKPACHHRRVWPGRADLCPLSQDRGDPLSGPRS